MELAISSSNVTQNVSPEHAVEVLQKLQLMSVRENGNSLCDVVLVAGKNGQKVRGHRAVLAACSPYFESLFTSNMLESTASEVILGDDVHGDYLVPLIQFCYTGKIEISADTVDELVLTASRLQLNAVVNRCCKIMAQNLDASNCLGVASLAKILSLPDLMQSAHKFACRHFADVSRQEEFLQLNIDRLKVLVASDELCVPSEETVFRSVMSWVHFERDEDDKRSEHIPTLLALVRLVHLPLSVLVGNVMDLCYEHACIPLCKEALLETIMPIRSRRIKPRKSVESGLLVAWLNNNQIRIAEYSPVKDEWNLIDKTFPYRAGFATAFFNNELIVFGGRDINKANFDTVVSINLETMTLSNLPSMTQKRSWFGSAVLDGFLYAAGGYITDREIDKVERYDPNDCKWSEVAPLSVKRHAFGLAVLDGRLFAVGGQNDSTSLNSTECYDPRTDKWTMLANLNTARSYHVIASGNGLLYAVGGRNATGYLKSIECYVPQIDKWTEISSLSSLNGFVECVFFDDCLLVFSWENGQFSLNDYNLVTDKWTERATLLGQKVNCLRAVLK